MDLKKIADSGQVFRIKCSEDSVKIISSDKCLVLDYGETIPNDSYWQNYFDISRDYSNIPSLVKDDPYLSKAVEFGTGLVLLKQDLWEMMISFIISQRNNIPRITSCIEKLCELCGSKISHPSGDFFAFPSPIQISTCDKSFSFLGYREKYVRELAEKICSGDIIINNLHNMNDNEAYQELLKIKGIGPKVANCILLFGLNRINSFPVDVWIKRILDREYEGVWDLEKYKGINGIVQMYMFYYERNK